MKDLSRMVRPKDAKINALSRLIDAGIIGCTLVALVSVLQLDWLPSYNWLLLITIVLFSYFTESSLSYKSWRDISLRAEVAAVLSNWGTIVLILVVIEFAFHPIDLYNREMVLYWFVLTPVELISWHSIMRMALRLCRDQGVNAQKVAIYGATELGVGLEKRIRSMSWASYNFVGFFDDRRTNGNRRFISDHSLIKGGSQELINRARAGEIDTIFITLPLAAEARIKKLLDDLSLSQVVANLINNAIKFTEKGFVHLQIESLSNKDGIINLQCSVSDSGKGIAQDKIAGLFEPFSQEDTSINRRYGGTGLGLSICKRLAETMGGDVTIESRESHGSTISFTCCLSEVDPAYSMAMADQIAVEPEPLLSGLIILIAEDNPFNQKLILKLLEAYGATCMLANNGQEAIELAGELHVDAVLMDIHMPVVDGVTACETIMQQSGESPPIIGLTADITQAEHQRMMSAGAISIQSKPLEEVNLVNAILSALSDQRELSEQSSEGLLSSVIPAQELKAALIDNLHLLEQQLTANEKASLRQIIHDLMGLCGLYGMFELRELVLTFRATYSSLTVAENLKKVQFIRQHIEDFFRGKSSN